QPANVDFSWHHALLPVYLMIMGRRLRRPIIHVVGWRRECLIRPTDRAMSISERVGLVSEAPSGFQITAR
ncbi:hypothetical protein, partial [Salmonella enterica]|uniref:hypothetical protein n=1 Tax=Salmonella enterica TaxID=28901 RepID=UPI000BD2888B